MYIVSRKSNDTIKYFIQKLWQIAGKGKFKSKDKAGFDFPKVEKWL